MSIRTSLSTRCPAFGLLPRLSLLALWLLATATVFVPSAAFAADVPDAATTASAAVDARAASYLDQLLGEINARRAARRLPPSSTSTRPRTRPSASTSPT